MTSTISRAQTLRLDRFLGVACLWILTTNAWAEHPFAFKRDTFSFANETVFEYHDGLASPRRAEKYPRTKRFTQRCFVMSRSVVQFQKFARFDPTEPLLNDKELAGRIRRITCRPPWLPPLARQDRIVIPGYRDLRALSASRSDILRDNIGLGWTTYFRPGNWRILLPHGSRQQARTHRELEHALARGDFFVAYLTTIPEDFSINHGVLVYSRQTASPDRNATGTRRYAVYDPNHAEAPRTLEWSPHDGRFLYQRDWDFVGGRVTVWQVYGRVLQ